MTASVSAARRAAPRWVWDWMLPKEGNTSLYLQYANARIRAIHPAQGG